jgi:uncharacterized membrane protein
MVQPFDYLDSMAWNIVISSVLLGIALLKLRYNAKTDSIEDGDKKTRIGFAFALGAAGFYQLITGLAISFTWPFGTPYGAQFQTPFTGGQFNVLFGGIATLGGLLLIAVALAMYFNGGFSVVTYFAAVAGIYGLVDAAAILIKNYTKNPLVSALGFIAFAVAAFVSVPAAHSNNVNIRRIAAVFAFLFAIVWAFEAVSFTLSHLGVIA